MLNKINAMGARVEYVKKMLKLYYQLLSIMFEYIMDNIHLIMMTCIHLPDSINEGCNIEN